MSKLRKTLRAEDLVNGALIRSKKTGGIYRLGPPKKRNVNMNVVNHCQLYYRNGKAAGTGTWWNLTNLRDAGFQLYELGRAVREATAGPGVATDACSHAIRHCFTQACMSCGQQPPLSECQNEFGACTEHCGQCRAVREATAGPGVAAAAGPGGAGEGGGDRG